MILDNLILAVNTITPMFLIILTGYVLKRIGLLDDKTAKQMNKVCFKIFMFLLLFNNIYSTKLTSLPSPRFILFCIVYLSIVFLLSFFIVPLFEKRNDRRGVIIQGFYRCNYVLLGLPMATFLLGEDSIGLAAATASVVIPLINLFSVIALEYYREGKTDWKNIIFNIIKNPFILGAVTAFVFLGLHITLPGPIETAVKQLSSCATPLALMIMGASLTFTQINNSIRPLVVTVLFRLLIIPIFAFSAAILIGFRGIELGILIPVIAAPTAVNSFTMAQAMGGDSDLASQIVLFTTIGSVFTLPLWIFLFKTFALI